MHIFKERWKEGIKTRRRGQVRDSIFESRWPPSSNRNRKHLWKSNYTIERVSENEFGIDFV